MSAPKHHAQIGLDRVNTRDNNDLHAKFNQVYVSYEESGEDLNRSKQKDNCVLQEKSNSTFAEISSAIIPVSLNFQFPPALILQAPLHAPVLPVQLLDSTVPEVRELGGMVSNN